MYQLPMELRGVDADGRTVDGVCVPYDEISYLTPNPAGERVLRGAFTKSVTQQATKVFMFRGHDHNHPVGMSVAFRDEPDGLHGTFRIRKSTLGDEVLNDLREGYLPAMSIGFVPVQVRRGRDGETEVVEGKLKEVSLLPIGAYDGARVLAVRGRIDVVMPSIPINLSPTMPGWAY